jgi:secreted protein with Ig-like and vWFA domain
MELLVAFVAGAVLAAWAMRWQSNTTHRKPAADPSSAQPAERSTTAESAKPKSIESPTARLNALIKELDDIGDDSAHPRDLLDRGAFHRAVGVIPATDRPLPGQ